MVATKRHSRYVPTQNSRLYETPAHAASQFSAHPNVKLFISHGGLLSISEAVYEGVPVLGIPIFGDQQANIKNIQDKGAGEILDYREISEEVVYEKTSRLLNNPE